MMEYIVVRSFRKTIAVSVKTDGLVEVRAPWWVSIGQIEKILKKKEKWILKQTTAVQKIIENRAKFSVKPGVKLPLLGTEYPVLLGKIVSFSNESFIIDSVSSAKLQIIKIYRKLAKNIISERIKIWASIIDVSPEGIRITSACKRFGSCSGKNSLCFSWKLVMADESLIDYVVVHELCHIKEHNHSARFWAEVEAVLPDYKERENRLKDFAWMLAGQDWTNR